MRPPRSILPPFVRTGVRGLSFLALSFAAQAQTMLSYTFDTQAPIPDEGEYLDVRSITLPPGADGQILDIRVSLNISGWSASTLAAGTDHGASTTQRLPAPYLPMTTGAEALASRDIKSALALAGSDGTRSPISTIPNYSPSPVSQVAPYAALSTGSSLPNLSPMTGGTGPGLGFNGDLFVTLANEYGGFAVLLNRPGKLTSTGLGYGDNGFTVSFSDSALNGDIHLYRQILGDPSLALSGPLTGEWQPDGRGTDPSNVLATDPRPNMLGSFIGTRADGEWRMFIADLSGGGLQQLSSWTLSVTIVPEPETYLTLGAGLVLLAGALRRRKQREHSPKSGSSSATPRRC